jgi:hypothetical protein
MAAVRSRHRFSPIAVGLVSLAFAVLLLWARNCAPSGGSVSREASGPQPSGTHLVPASLPEIPGPLKRGSDFKVVANREKVSLIGGPLPTQSMAWSDVRRISIITTADRPQQTDVFVNLEGERARVLIPQDSDEHQAFIDLLVKVVDFDLKNFARAMGSAEPAEFQCWAGSSVAFRH